jgi:pimeloyl-ACP methyl ester carboxylesterase
MLFLWLMGLAAEAPSARAQNLQELFDPPSSEEISQVRQQWAVRNTTPSAYSVHRTAEADGFTLSRVSYVLDDLQLYGVVRYPRHYTESGTFPVLVLMHGGFTGFWYDYPLHFDADFTSQCIADSFLVVCPTYRGETLAGGDLLGGAISEGETSFWDYDCDDTMAMLTAVLENIPAADENRIVALGQSRGGNVAYHLAIRDPRIMKTAVLFPPSQFRDPSIQTEVQDHYDGVQNVTNPLPEKVVEEIITPYLAGLTTLAEARHHLTAWSACNFLSADLQIQVHHGDADDTVPVLHSDIVDEEMRQQGAAPPEFQYLVYGGGHHVPSSLIGYEPLMEDFLCSVPGEVSAVPDAISQDILRAYPNPFAGQVALEISGGVDKYMTVDPIFDIMDMRGRRVRSLVGQGLAMTSWDGCDDSGRQLPAGSYLVALRGNPQIQPVNLLLLK